MRTWLPILLLVVPLAGCVRRSVEATSVAPPAEARPIELWVDAAAPGPGDGSRERPFKALGPALGVPGRPLRIHLRGGMYPGPFSLPDGAELEGEGLAVLFAEGPAAVVTVRGGARLSGLTVQGGAVGIDAEGSLSLERVQLSGQRQAAVRLGRGALVARGSTFQASVSNLPGLVLEAGTHADIEGSAFLGPWRRAVQAREAQRVTIEGCRFEGAVTGLHQVGGEARVRRTTLAGGRGPALFKAGGALRVEEVEVKGHEYALQTRQVDPLVVRDFTSLSAELAGLGLVETRGELDGVRINDSGPFGGIQVVRGEIAARRFRIHRPSGYGVSAHQAGIVLEQGVITGVRDQDGSAGNGVELREAIARVSGLTVVDAAGVGLLSAQGSRVTVEDLWLERCRWGGVVVETLGEVRGSAVVVRDSPGPAVAIPGDGEVDLYQLVSERNTAGAIWAECDRGARARLREVREDGPPRPRSPCVQQ